MSWIFHTSNEAGQVATFGWFGAECAQRRIEDPLRVVAAKAEGLDGLIGRGTAGATKASASRSGQVAVQTG